MARTPAARHLTAVSEFMQIVAGRFRHRKLETNPGDTTRPILTRVKVALFDLLQPLFAGARVADIYSGTGTIGLEALSRGAARVTFIEADRKAFELLRKNVAKLRVDEETFCWQTDVTKCSFRPKNSAGFLPFEIVFFDPPYAHTSKLAPGTMLYRALQRLARDGITTPGALLVLRCDTDTKFQMPDVWHLEETLDYSSMTVHLFRRTDRPVPADTDQLPDAAPGDPATPPVQPEVTP